jgi:hypothetical protein
MTRHRVGVANEAPKALDVTGDEFIVSPNKFLDAVCDDLQQYVDALRDPSQTVLRANFLARYIG